MTGTASHPAGERLRPAALDARTMCEAFQLTAAAQADDVALRTLGDAVSISFREYRDRVARLAAGLHALGVGHGDTVGFMLTNRPEFHLLDTAAMHLGAAPFSIYNTSSEEQIAYLLHDAASAVVIVEAAFAPRMAAAAAQTGTVHHTILIDAEAGDALGLDALEARGTAATDFDFEATWRAVTGDDVLTLIYTSGTTGPPKGVQLTHANQLAQCRGLDEATGWRTGGGSVVSFLPNAHIADRGLNHYAQMVWGPTITTCPDPGQVFAHVLDARPTRFGAVPRVWEKLQAALQAGIDGEPDPARRTAITEAIALGLRKVGLEQAGDAVPDELAVSWAQADRLVFAPLRAGLGFDRCEIYVIGAAPAPVEMFQFFAAIGIPICEVWGMSELSCVATLVPADAPRYGTVGRPLPGVELRLADDGEVLVRGDIVMAGYRNQPEMTARRSTPTGGWPPATSAPSMRTAPCALWIARRS